MPDAGPEGLKRLRCGQWLAAVCVFRKQAGRPAWGGYSVGGRKRARDVDCDAVVPLFFVGPTSQRWGGLALRPQRHR